MRISIVTISYNQGRFLEEAILSVVEQDYGDVEFIVVDAGSTDDSRSIIESYRGRIAKLILEPDQGPADGLNKGFVAATGEIFGFLNSDDILEADALTQVVNFFRDHPEIDVVSGHAFIIDENGNKRRRVFSDRFSLRMAAYGASILVQPSTFFRAELFRDIGGFNKNNRISWDSELFVDMAIEGARFARYRGFWSRYRVYRGSITGAGKANDALRRSTSDRIFRKIMSRDRNLRDRYVELTACYFRKLLNFSDTLERVRYGPVSKTW